MINFIKDAISSVEGIADFRFYDDYKFSEEQGQLSYPCAVLQPIPSMTFNRNRQITDKIKIVLSIFEVTPKDYDGDTLYALQKKCADLMLQVLANLDVKTKFSDDVQVATILPEGDELLCGAMISLELTMRQPRCIGAPSYVEVVVQPVKRESITTNGKYTITPSSGFNAMREVEVDVQIGELTTEEKSVDITRNGEVEILPTSADAMTKVTANVQVPLPPLEEKQVTITRNGTTEIVPTSEYGLSRVEVVADVAPNLQDKQVTITENGTQTIVADEGYEGLSSVEVNANVTPPFGLIGWDVNDISYYNAQLAENIAYSKTLYDAWDPNNTSASYFFYSASDLVYAPHIDTSNVINMSNMFGNCPALISIPKLDTSKVTNMMDMFKASTALRDIPLLDTHNVTIMPRIFVSCKSLVTIPPLDLSNVTSIENGFQECTSLKYIPPLNLGKVKNFSLLFYNCSSLIEISQINTSNGTNFNSTFGYCMSLTEIPQIDTSQAIVFQNLFIGCSALKTIPLLDASNVTNMNTTFIGCTALENFGGLKNIKVGFSLSISTKLTHESLMNVINNLYDLASNGLATQTLTLGATNLAKLTEEEQAIAVNKGWTLA